MGDDPSSTDEGAGRTTTADLVDEDDAGKTEKLAKAGREDLDTDEGSD